MQPSSRLSIWLRHECRKRIGKNRLEADNSVRGKGGGEHLSLCLMFGFVPSIGEIPMDTSTSIITAFLHQIGTMAVHLVRRPWVKDGDMVRGDSNVRIEALVGIIDSLVMADVYIVPQTPQGSELISNKGRREFSQPICIPNVLRGWEKEQTQDRQVRGVREKNNDHFEGESEMKGIKYR